MFNLAPAEAPVTRLEVPPGQVIGPGRAPATFRSQAGRGDGRVRSGKFLVKAC